MEIPGEFDLFSGNTHSILFIHGKYPPCMHKIFFSVQTTTHKNKNTN